MALGFRVHSTLYYLLSKSEWVRTDVKIAIFELFAEFGKVFLLRGF